MGILHVHLSSHKWQMIEVWI